MDNFPKKDFEKILSSFSGLERELMHQHMTIAESQKMLSSEAPMNKNSTKDSSSALENLLKTLVLKLNNNEIKSTQLID